MLWGMKLYGAEFVKEQIGEALKTGGMENEYLRERIGSVVHLLLVILFFVAVAFGIIALYKTAFPAEIFEPYLSTQTVSENKPDGELNYLDIDGKGIFVPMLSETLDAAIAFGKSKGEENKIYGERVVVMSLDPSIRYHESPSGISQGVSYDNLYTFYIPDGEDIKDDSTREHRVSVGDSVYKITLLSIDGRNYTHNYTFRIEKVLE